MALASAKQIAYVPILKWKRGEQTAVSSMSDSTRRRILPLAEIQDRPYDWQAEDYTKDWEEHIEAVIKATVRSWGRQFEIAFDQPIDSSDDERGGRGRSSIWALLFNRLWDAEVRAVPVVSSWAPDEEVAALAELPRRSSGGRYLLRCHFDEEEHGDSVRAVSAWYRRTLKEVGASHEDVDVVFDAGYFAGEDVSALNADFCAAVLKELSLQGPWRTLTLASGAFPANLAGLKTGAHKVVRFDWRLFRDVADQFRYRLVYGDYGVSHPETSDLDPRTIRMSANLRYTCSRYWRVYKAKNVKDHGFDQYKDLCRLLVESDEFYGANFSDGDENFRKVAEDSTSGPGSATIWRRDATNHHIHVVLGQLRELGQ